MTTPDALGITVECVHEAKLPIGRSAIATGEPPTTLRQDVARAHATVEALWFLIQSDHLRALCAVCGEPVVEDGAIWTFVPERVRATRTFPIHERCFRRIAHPEALALLERYADSSPPAR